MDVGVELGALYAGGELEMFDELVVAAGSPADSEFVAGAELDVLYAGGELEVAYELAAGGADDVAAWVVSRC